MEQVGTGHCSEWEPLDTFSTLHFLNQSPTLGKLPDFLSQALYKISSIRTLSPASHS
jgi:hypothetical protein